MNTPSGSFVNKGCAHRLAQTTHCALCQVQKSGDYFEFMQIPRKYKINHGELKRIFRKEQAKYHPDLFMNRDVEDRKESELISSKLNKAYQTLRDPLSRAKHLLKLNGVEISEDFKIQDPEFLMNVMELQERIVEANEGELKALFEENDVRFQETVNGISRAFEAKDYALAQQLIVKLNYWSTIKSLINDHLL